MVERAAESLTAAVMSHYLVEHVRGPWLCAFDANDSRLEVEGIEETGGFNNAQRRTKGQRRRACRGLRRRRLGLASLTLLALPRS